MVILAIGRKNGNLEFWKKGGVKSVKPWVKDKTVIHLFLIN
jgi:hypothetical protein